MSTLKKLFYSNLIVATLVGCSKHITDDYPVEYDCEKYAGQYLMYDSTNDEYYEMIIECDPKVEGQKYDSLQFMNYANNFCIKHRIITGGLTGAFFFPAYDNYGKRWALTVGGLWPSDSLANTLRGDSLNIHFSIDNSAFYMEDSVPYQFYELTHLGVKIH